MAVYQIPASLVACIVVAPMFFFTLVAAIDIGDILGLGHLKSVIQLQIINLLVW